MTEIQLVICPECGHEQPDMGRNVRAATCGREECCYGPMPTDTDNDAEYGHDWPNAR